MDFALLRDRAILGAGNCSTALERIFRTCFFLISEEFADSLSIPKTLAPNLVIGSDNKPPGVDSTGLQFKEEILKINIPSGVGDGMQLSMTGKGNESPGGGVSGDLLILIEENEDDNFKRDGNNVVYDLYINFVDAAIGNELEVPTLNGKVKVKIPPGTQSGKIFRLRGKGIKDLNTSITGDQLIHVNIWIQDMQ